MDKKRPRLIPILDNQATFGAYLNPRWPRSQHQQGVYAEGRIREVLGWITVDLTRPEITATWAALCEIEPTRLRVELFDMVWWVRFRQLQPVGPTSSV